MKYVDLQGESGAIDVGEVPCGVGFQLVVIEYTDVTNPEFMSWFVANILHRMCLPVAMTTPH